MLGFYLLPKWNFQNAPIVKLFLVVISVRYIHLFGLDRSRPGGLFRVLTCSACGVRGVSEVIDIKGILRTSEAPQTSVDIKSDFSAYEEIATILITILTYWKIFSVKISETYFNQSESKNVFLETKLLTFANSVVEVEFETCWYCSLYER